MCASQPFWLNTRTLRVTALASSGWYASSKMSGELLSALLDKVYGRGGSGAGSSTDAAGEELDVLSKDCL